MPRLGTGKGNRSVRPEKKGESHAPEEGRCEGTGNRRAVSLTYEF